LVEEMLHYAWRMGTEWWRCDFRTNLIFMRQTSHSALRSLFLEASSRSLEPSQSSGWKAIWEG
jgi:hypothetical protein